LSYLNRGGVYLAFALLGLAVAGTVRASARVVAGGLAALLFGVVGWALLGKVFPSLFPDGARVARLRDPIGYWNALALACALALPLGLWAATRRSWRRELRAAGVVRSIWPSSLNCHSRGQDPRRRRCGALWLAFVPAARGLRRSHRQSCLLRPWPAGPRAFRHRRRGRVLGAAVGRC
jgi:hypothetical protein